MPELTKLRYACLGTSKARIGDLTLTLEDAHGEPAFSTLWLRNGGGKSMMLDLLFATFQPNRNTWRRANLDVEDYLRSDDHGIVAAEWALDRQDASSAGRPRLITGAFYEYGGTESRLRRLFFAYRALDGEPALSLEQLPLYTERDGQRMRNRMTGFRERLKELRQAHPNASVALTSRQSDWKNTLRGYEIDPQLMTYQMMMNETEGGAADLFKGFDEPVDFANFLLEVTLDLDQGEEVARLLEKYREQLRKRTQQYRPEMKLLGGLEEPVHRLREIHEQRAENDRALAVAGRRLEALGQGLEARVEDIETDIEESRVLNETAREELDTWTNYAERLEEGQALLHRKRQKRLHAVLMEHRQQAEQNRSDARYRRQLWEAALPLRTVRRETAQAEALRAQLDSLKTEYAELLEQRDDAAGRFVAALKARRDQLTEDLDACANQQDELQEVIRELDEAIGNTRRKQDDLTSRWEQLDDAREQWRDARKQFRSEGVLDAEETIPEARERIEGELEATRTRREELEERAARLEVRRDEKREAREAVREELRAVRSEYERVGAELSEAREKRSALESDPDLLETLELDTLDLRDASPSGLLSALHEREQEHLTRLLQARVDRSRVERALKTLEARDLLPPPEGVERVHAYLDDRGFIAWPGGRYLAEHLPDAGRARDVLRHRPYLLNSVVVRSTAFEDVREALAQFDGRLEQPVGLLPQSAAPHTGAEGPDEAPPLHVLPPSSDAHFNTEAGKNAEQQYGDEFESLQARVEQCSERQRTVGQYRERLRQYFDQWPEDWWEERNERRAHLERNIGELEDRDADLSDELETLESEREEVRKEQTALRERRDRREQQLRRLRAFDLPQPSMKALEERLQEVQNTLAGLDEQLQERISSRDEKREKRAGLQERRDELIRQIDRVEERISGVGSISPGEIEPAPGDIPSLEAAYRSAREACAENIDEEELTRQIEEHEQAASAARTAFRDRVKGASTLTTDEVRDALDKLDDLERVPELREQAERDLQSAEGDVAARQNQVENAEDDRAEAVSRCEELGIQDERLPETVPDDLARLEQYEDQVEHVLERFRARVNQLTDDVQQFKHQIQQRKHERKVVSRAADQARRFRERRYQRLLERAREVRGEETEGEAAAELDVDPVSAPPERLEAELDDIEDTLEDALEVHERLDEQRAEQAQVIQEWLLDEEFDLLESPVRRHIRRWSNEQLEQQAGELYEKLEMRRETIARKLESAEEDREFVARSLLEEARQGVKVLQKASRRSRIPEGVRGHGGARFLRLTTHMPDSPDEQRVRMANLVDDLAREEETPTGEALIQRAVQRLARPIRASVITPDRKETDRNYRPVTEFESLSEGEALTMAIMMFSTLAKLRSEQHNRRSARHTLVFDNPFGRASRPTLVELQTEMARAMDVQLVYATGVKDFEAVRMLPNWIRIRNDQIDQRTGDQYLQLAESATEGLEAVQVGHTEHPTLAAPETEDDNAPTP